VRGERGSRIGNAPIDSLMRAWICYGSPIPNSLSAKIGAFVGDAVFGSAPTPFGAQRVSGCQGGRQLTTDDGPVSRAHPELPVSASRARCFLDGEPSKGALIRLCKREGRTNEIRRLAACRFLLFRGTLTAQDDSIRGGSK
jgi:hypothetical protein